ncbi:hypothetical protein NAEGRDRAFT_78918 [Naegleria gruberi]|uniref:Uncharacterized protein n=1 Tax=Naegleria gruberi TaxID=5762 RepID=D2V7M6_NAEGR|nr:uncharacterized protein NAEGRDRAFT_78918 [Naegleria gruberi]EFC47276.1 hypothetical protein NAEGRDRAFT_78918 [Naegleria gruberi]|eukprot:XP_002680020.1 hypothetical protein NAEGRDRAFT_78918 [Naegleria gruberi strain NEG-M]
MTQDPQPTSQPTTISTSNDKLHPPSTSTTQLHHPTESHTKKDADNESNKSSTKSSFRRKQKQRGCLCFRGGKAIKVNTCCGVLELSWIKVLAIVGMALNSFTFLVLLALLIFSQNSNAATNIDLLAIRSDLYLYTAWVDAYTLVAAYSQNKTYLNYYYNYRDTLNTLKDELVSKLPSTLVSQLNSTESYQYSTYLEAADTLAVNMMENGNYSGAVSVLTSGFYYATKLKYRNLLDIILKYILDSQTEAENLSDAAVISSLVIIMCSCCSDSPCHSVHLCIRYQ